MQRQTDEQQTQIKQISITRSYLLKSISSTQKNPDVSSKIKFWSSPGFSLQCRRLLKNWMCKFASGAFMYSRYLCLWKVYFHLDLLKVGLFSFYLTGPIFCQFCFQTIMFQVTLSDPKVLKKPEEKSAMGPILRVRLWRSSKHQSLVSLLENAGDNY